MRPLAASGVFLPLLVFLVSTSVAIGSYSHILESERPRVRIPTEIFHVGQYSLAILSNGSCVGTIGVHVQREDSTLADAKLSLRAVYGKILTKTDLTIHAIFNPLGQFLQGTFSLDGPGVSIRAEAQDTSPIEIAVKGTAGERSVDLSHRAPGPIVLASLPSGEFTLTAPYGLMGSTPVVDQIVARMKAAFPLTIEPMTTSMQDACADESKRLNIAPILQQLQSEQFLLGGTL